MKKDGRQCPREEFFVRRKLVFEYDGWSLKLLECPFTLSRTFAGQTWSIGESILTVEIQRKTNCFTYAMEQIFQPLAFYFRCGNSLSVNVNMKFIHLSYKHKFLYSSLHSTFFAGYLKLLIFSCSIISDNVYYYNTNSILSKIFRSFYVEFKAFNNFSSQTAFWTVAANVCVAFIKIDKRAYLNVVATWKIY